MPLGHRGHLRERAPAELGAVADDIDRIILAKLKSKDLSPAPPAPFPGTIACIAAAIRIIHLYGAGTPIAAGIAPATSVMMVEISARRSFQ